MNCMEYVTKIGNLDLKLQCDYRHAYILVKETITLIGQAADAAVLLQANRNNKQVIFKFLPFIECTTEISNTQLDNTEDLDIVMLM